MAATGNEFVLLRQLKLATDSIFGSIRSLDHNKLNAPASAGTDGQMLVYGSSGNQWIDVPEGTAYSADNTTLQLTGTQFSVKDKGITAAKIADGVIPDVSDFITQTEADAAYAAKSHMHTVGQVTDLQSALDGKVDTPSRSVGNSDGFELALFDMGNKVGIPIANSGADPIYIMNEQSGYTIGIKDATATSSGAMSAADKTKLDGINISMATDKDAKAFFGY